MERKPRLEESKVLSKDNEKVIDNVVAAIHKSFGAESVTRLGDGAIANIPFIPTGSLGLDLALGIGGVPRGRVIEIYGPEASGKTTLALHIIAEAQKAGGVAGFVDAEHALDLKYARKLGVDVDNLLLSQPDNGEQALEIVELLVVGGVKVVVVDSVAALVPKAEIEGDMGDSHMGLQARLMSQACRKLTGLVSKNGTCLIFINQIRMKIGVMFGNPETTTGGNALKFYASVRIDVRKIGDLKVASVDGKGEKKGVRTRAKVVKNKVAPPFGEAEYSVLWGKGISRNEELVDLGVEHGLVEKAGAWYSYGQDRIGQGKENSVVFLNEHMAMAKEIEVKLLKIIRGNE